ncbi:MAG: TetR/AcrR family transcriptional regulator [Thermoleophilia bacterium]|nr:TetR/AcrR family transcriptional regulator [Thermoleophilia bacterium]MDQ3858731.1 TetR/AcrR family transcriptional regulator [Actinomycetota bacterium]
MTTRIRLPAAERRAAVLEAASRVFSRGSYHGTTTAEIAREAGVTEPILYRHFASKRDLYLACLDAAWAEVRALWDRTVADEPSAENWLLAMARAFFRSERNRAVISTLWVQAIAEAGEDPAIRRYMRRHMREVHAYVADVIARAQEQGGVCLDRDPRAEAWLFLSVGLLKMVSGRLGGLLEGDFPQIVASRRRWLTGREFEGTL